MTIRTLLLAWLLLVLPPPMVLHCEALQAAEADAPNRQVRMAARQQVGS